MCLVAQVSYIPSHKVAVNTGFQINYGLPYNSSNFWSPAYWARSFVNNSSPLTSFFAKLSESDADEFSFLSDNSESNTIQTRLENDDDEFKVETTEQTEVSEYEETATTQSSTEKPKRKKKSKKPKTKRDLTAGELYMGLTDTLSL